MPDQVRVFLAGAFSRVGTNGGQVEGETRIRLEGILSCLRRLGVPIFSAHEREQWGIALDEPLELFELDLRELDVCSHVIAYLGFTDSPGTCIELGYALARQKSVLVVQEAECNWGSDFVAGMLKSSRVQLTTAGGDEKVLCKVIEKFLWMQTL